jgi:hypothetical protein
VQPPLINGSKVAIPAADEPSPSGDVSRRVWAKPVLAELPRLTELTLQMGSSIGGGPTVF